MKSLVIILFFLITGCISPGASAKPKMDQLELQEDIQRFFSRFTERVVQSFIDPAFNSTTQIREASMQEYLLYEQEALKITTGPYPELNLLDMLVFIKLNKVIVRDYWIPKRYGKKGQKVWAAFKKSEEDIENIARKLLTKEELKQIDTMVVQWFKQNPGQYRVEKIRIGDFSGVASEINKNRQGGWGGIFSNFSVSNLLVDTKGAVKAVDQMVLVANRAMFLIQHMPSLMRLQARLGTYEIIDDVSFKLSKSEKFMHSLQETKPLMVEAASLLHQMNELMLNAKGLSHSMNKTVPKGINFSDDIKEVHDTVSTMNSMLTEVNANRPVRRAMLDELKQELHDSVWFLAMVIILIALCISIFWWGGAYLVRRRLQKTEGKL